MKTVLLALIIFCFCPYLARADTRFPANCSVPAPDISGWELVSDSRIEFRLSDSAVAYLGLAVEYTEYRNPADARESVKIFSRHIPLISEQKKLNEEIILDAATALYNREEERKRFEKIDKEIDPILFIRWQTEKNPRTGRSTKDGDVDMWFLASSGECLIDHNEKVSIQFLTESVGNGDPHNVFVGVKYQVGDAYHILKVDRSDVTALMEGGR